MTRISLCLTSATAIALASYPASAQEAPSTPQASSGPGHRAAHSEEPAGNEIVVTAHPPIDFGLMAGTESIEGDRLIAQSRGQIGETLAKLPGVSATSFAPGASRPVLRGFSGARVTVLTDGIGSIDASSVSEDHAVVLDSLTVDHIDILHGPAVLVFGGQAIGGAVNALDKRIPRRVPDAISADFVGGYGSAADEWSVGGAVDFPLGERFVAHLDASWRDSDDLEIGGFVNSALLRRELLAEAEELRAEGEAGEAGEFEELASLRGVVPNTAARTWTVGAGLAFIDAGGNLGISYHRFDTRYGVPLRPGAGHHHEEELSEGEIHLGEEEEGDGHAAETVSIDLVQDRFDLRGAIELGGIFESLQLRGAYGDYEHVELEGDEVGTRFSGEGIEFRADLIQDDRDGWRGRSGVHYLGRSMDIEGAEAFTPDYDVESVGFFTLQALEIGSGIELEAAGRFQTTKVTSNDVDFRRSFDQWSAGAGVSWTPAYGLKVGANYLRGARAPSPEELLSDGLHVATQAYELGDPGFGVEKSDGLEAYVRWDGERGQVSITGYVTEFDNFIAAIPTGEEIEDFPVFRYRQLPATFKGFEASASYRPLEWAGGSLQVDAAADYTHAKLDGIGPVPRIPPLRLQGGVEARHEKLRIRAEVEWNDRQDRVPQLANAVPSFTHVNLSGDWHPMGEDGPVTLLVAANNIFDTTGRRAASFTRDFVPLHGRDLRATLKVSF